MTTPLLQLQSLSIRFGGLVAVNDVSFKLKSGELVGIIGPNGAGKTTVFNMLTGHYRPSSGDILLEGHSIVGRSPAAITCAGMARTFQNIRLFKDLTVLDNIRTAAHSRIQYGIFASILRTPKVLREEDRIYRESRELLKIFELEDVSEQLAKNLPYGKQRRLEIARALATKARILLLDEPAAGMNAQETASLTKLIGWVREHFQVAVLLIEHDMRLVMNVCEYIYVLNHGKLIASGTPQQIQKNPQVIQAYLGSSESSAHTGENK